MGILKFHSRVFPKYFYNSGGNFLAKDIYLIILNRAREPHLYSVFKVPDTVDGRFEMITLHMFLVLRRLKGSNRNDNKSCQDLFDYMFTDMDLSLREMGAGDMGVGKRVKAMVQAFYGRVVSYERALEVGKPELENALKKNVYSNKIFEHNESSLLADYVWAQDLHLSKLEKEEMKGAQFSFGPIES